MNITDQQASGKAVVSHRGWTLVDGPHDGTFTDDGRGAFQDEAKRPAWEAMLATKPDVIVVRDAARLGRNIPDYAALLLTKAKVVTWLDQETAEVNLDAPLVNTDTEEFASKTVGSRAYSQSIGRGVKRKIRTKAQKGAWPHGGTRPFGYHHPPKCCGKDGDCSPGDVMPDEAAVIRAAAEMWLNGMNLSQLCRFLTSEGVVTPKGLPWQYARLRAMLTGPRIAGIRVHNGVEHKGTWDAIIDLDLHKRLCDAASESMVKRANQNGVYLLSNLAYCGVCEVNGLVRKMYGHRQHATDRPVRLRYICREGCGQGIAAVQLDEFVVNRSFMAILAPELRDQEQSRRDLAASLAEVKDLEERLAELDDAYWQERQIAKDRWAKQSAALNASLTAAQAAAEDARRRVRQQRDAPTTAEALGERWQVADITERNRLLGVGLERAVIHASSKGARFDPTRLELRFRDGRIERVREEDLLTKQEERILRS